MQDIVESWLKVCENALPYNLCQKKSKTKRNAECRVNPSLCKPHGYGLFITEHMRTLHVLVVADKFSKRANLIRSQRQQGGLHSSIVFVDHTMLGYRNPNIFRCVFNSLFCFTNRSKLRGYIWSPSFRQRIFKHRCPKKERNSEQSINTGMF